MPEESMTAISLVPLLMLLIVILVPVSIVIWIARYFREMADERRRLRLEVSKLAHEMAGLRNARGESDGEAARENTVLDGGS
jgi:uncharacterized membrane protein